MNDELHDDTDPTQAARLRSRLDSVASTVSVEGDVTDVRRRLRHQGQMRTSLMGVAAAVAVIATVAAWPGHDSQRLSLADGAGPADTTTVPATAAKPGGISLETVGFRKLSIRTTADGVTLAYGDQSTDTAYWTAPTSCLGPRAVVAALSGSGATLTETLGNVSTDSTPADPATTLEVTPSYVPFSISASGVTAGGKAVGEVATLSSGDGPGTTSVVPPGSATTLTPVAVQQTPIGLVTVTGSAVKHATATFSNGTTDQADATAGAVVLGTRFATTTSSSAALDGPVVVTLDVTLRNGTVVRLVDLVPSPGNTYDLHGNLLADGTKASGTGSTGTGTTVDSTTPQCVAPPAPLPAPGPQPADATAAKAAATAAVTGFFNTRDQATQATYVSDRAFAQAVLAELGGGGFATAAATATATVKDLVFVSPTEALVRYDVDLTPTGNEPISIPKDFFHNTYGELVLTDGQWRLTPESICKVTSQATPKACAAHLPTNYPTEVFGPGGSATKPTK